MRSIIIILLGFFISNIGYSQCRVDSLLTILNDGGKSPHVMVFAHRGDWRHVQTENSISAYKRCIDEGLDGIEVDLQMTKDSVLIVMHDDTIDRTTTGTGKVSDYTWEELSGLKLRSPIGVISRERIPTFEDVLVLAKDKILIQVDKWKPYSKEVSALVNKHDCARQIILRTTDKRAVMDKKYGNLFDGFIIMPVLVCKGGEIDNEKFEDFTGNYTSPALSFSFTKEDYPILKRMKDVGKSGQRLWLNSLWDTFNAGHDEEMAITDPDNSYGWLINQGANIIFSDNPTQLKNYLIKINRW